MGLQRVVKSYWISVMCHNITNVTLNLIQGPHENAYIQQNEMLKQVQHDAKTPIMTLNR